MDSNKPINKTNTIIFATSNINKVAEVSLQITLPKIEIISLKELGFREDIPETAPDFKGNALQKAQHIYDIYHTNVFAEDTGLEVNALNMQPGVRTARYAGQDKNDVENMKLLLNNLESISDRSAQFRTVIALIYKGENYFFEGHVKGTIAKEKSGNLGFGYDPIFIPNGYDKTFSHFTKEEKNKISHRGIAVKKLINFLNSI